MADTYTKVLEIQLNYEKAIKGIAEYEREITSARQQQEVWRNELKSLQKQFDDGAITADQYADAQKAITEQMAASKVVINQLKNEQATLTKHLQQEVKIENAQADSLVQLRARLSNLTAEYDALSGEMRSSDVGVALRDQINEVTDVIKNLEEDTQRYYRNVGNYTNSVREAFAAMNKELETNKKKLEEVEKQEGANSAAANELRKSIEQQEAALNATTNATNRLYSTIIPFGDKIIPLLGSGLKGVKSALKLAAEGAKTLGKQFLALMANPIVAFLALVAAAIAILVKGIAGSEENMNRWSKAMTPITRGLKFLQAAIEVVCGWILSFVEGAGKLLSVFFKLAEALPIVGGAIADMNDEIEASIKLEEREQKLAKDKRDLIVRSAKDELEIAKLKKEANDKSNEDVEARIAAAKKANDIELKLSEERKRIAQEEFDIAKAKAAQAGNSAEDNKELADLEAAVYKAEMEYFNKSKELQSQINQMEKEAAAEKKKAAEDAIKLSKERKEKELSATRAYEDAMLQLITDSVEKQRKQIETSYNREIEDLQKKLKTEQNLTAKAREAINETIKAKELQKAQALAQINEQEITDAIAREQKKVQLRLDAVKKGTEEEYKMKLEQNRLNLEADLAQTDKEIENLEEREQMKALIRDKYAAQEIELTKQRNDEIAAKEKETIQLQFQEKLLQAADNAMQQAQIELEQKKYELDNLQQMEGESIEAFNVRKLQLQNDYLSKKKTIADAEVKMEQDKDKAIASLMGSISSAIESLAGDNKEAAALAKVVGLAEVYINQAVAISEAIKNATEGDPYTMAARIAAAVASVVAGTVSAFQSISKAHFAKGGKAGEDGYATGGRVSGAGSGTSDSIPAMLSNGEFVMTAVATQMFEPILRVMNAIGAGFNPLASSGQMSLAPSSADMISGSVSSSMADMHPVVSVVDINEGQSRVKVIEAMDTF